MKKIALFLILAALVGLNVVSHSQNQPPQNTVEKGDQEGQFTLKTATEIVLVNVTVRDKNNNAVKDLKLQDFTVLEDGKKQDVISVDAENTDSIVTSEVPKTELLTNLTTASAKTNTVQP